MTASTANAQIKCVILLHGLSRTSRSMHRMCLEIEKAGFVVLNIDYPSRERSISELSEQFVGPAVARAKALGASEVNFVTHSMGGILVRDYYSKHPTNGVHRVVMLGPPNAGSEVVDYVGKWRLFSFINGPAGTELGTDETSKPNQLGAVHFELGVIAGCKSINWINSLMIAGPDDGKVSVERTKVQGMKSHLVMDVTHPMMMRNRKVIDQTIRFLTNGEFASHELGDEARKIEPT